jgi:GTP-binding protein
LHTIFSTIEKIREQAKMNVSTSMLNRTLAQAEFSNNAPKIKGDRISISYATQVKGKIPTFVIFVNNPDHLHFSYARYIENKIRDAFGIDCVPITLYYKSKNARIRTKKDDEHVQ